MTDVTVTKFDGAPGTGKTHNLLDVIERELEDAADWRDITYLNFTNTGKHDAKAAMLDRFDIDTETADATVATFHSAAFNATADAGYYDRDADDVIRPRNNHDVYAAFAEKEGMRYEGNTLRDITDRRRAPGNGDAFFTIYDYLSNAYKPPKKARDAPVPFPWRSIGVYERLAHKWNTFKREYDPEGQLWQDSDYMETAIDNNLYLPAPVLIIDEFQDLSPLEYKYYMQWRDSGLVDRVYIAGDPQQSIYSFRAADPYYFENTPVDETHVLNESYRCRGEVADLARAVLATSPGDDAREFTPKYPGGVVETINGSQTSTLRRALDTAIAPGDADALVLTRTNGQWKRVARWLRNNGYPYRMLGRHRSMWDDVLTDLYDALRALARGTGDVDAWAATKLMDLSPQTKRRKETAEFDGDSQTFTVESLWSAYPDVDRVEDLVLKLEIHDRKAEALREALLNDVSYPPEQLRVGTVHAAKGLEAETVLLFPMYGSQLTDAYRKDVGTQAEEHRVAYVAATRAKTRLQVVHGFFDHKQVMPPFRSPGAREVMA